MDSPQPSTSTMEPKKLLREEKRNLDRFGKETYNLLKYVYDQLRSSHNMTTVTETENIHEPEDALHRVQRYTGLHMNTLEKLLHQDIRIDKLKEIDRKCVHEALMRFYLKDNLVPTSTELFNRLHDSLPPYEDIRSFRKILVKMGYMFKKKGINFVVFENPTIKFERFFYLKKIIQYRQDKRPIYFVCEAALSSNKILNVDESIQYDHQQSRFIVAASSHTGIKCFKHVTSFDKIAFNEWLLQELIPTLVSDSVVILDNSKHHCDTYCNTPNKSSLKCEMIDWLTYHQIPFDKQMSKVELYTLIKKCTDLETNLHKVDIWLRQHGYDVLRLPECINDLTPAAFIRFFLSDQNIHLNTREKLKLEVNGISDYKLNAFNEVLFEEEKKLYDLELKLDVLLDNLETTLSLCPEIDIYLPSLSDSD